MSNERQREQFAAEVSYCLLNQQGFEFRAQDFTDLMRPSVYLFLKDGLPSYIGLSSHGVARTAGANHQKASLRANADRILIYPCKSLALAHRLERALILAIQPPANKRLKKAPRPSRVM